MNTYQYNSTLMRKAKQMIVFDIFVGENNNKKFSACAGSATFRINFYDEKNGFPNQRIIYKNIIERMSVKKGLLIIDLANENIVINQNFFISFEFMPQQKMLKYSLSYGGQLGGNYITRKSSLGNWEKGKDASLSAYVSLRQ